MTMKDWILKLKDLADKMAEDEYKIFKQNLLKNYESDFDKMTKMIENKK